MVIRNFALPVLLALGGSIIGLLAASKGIGLYWPYALMLLGMNSNKAEDVIAGHLAGFFVSSGLFMLLFCIAANVILTKRDVYA